MTGGHKIAERNLKLLPDEQQHQLRDVQNETSISRGHGAPLEPSLLPDNFRVRKAVCARLPVHACIRLSTPLPSMRLSGRLSDASAGMYNASAPMCCASRLPASTTTVWWPVCSEAAEHSVHHATHNGTRICTRDGPWVQRYSAAV